MTLDQTIDYKERQLKEAKKLLQRMISDLTDEMHDMSTPEYLEKLGAIILQHGGYAEGLENTIAKLLNK